MVQLCTSPPTSIDSAFGNERVTTKLKRSPRCMQIDLLPLIATELTMTKAAKSPGSLNRANAKSSMAIWDEKLHLWTQNRNLRPSMLNSEIGSNLEEDLQTISNHTKEPTLAEHNHIDKLESIDNRDFLTMSALHDSFSNVNISDASGRAWLSSIVDICNYQCKDMTAAPEAWIQNENYPEDTSQSLFEVGSLSANLDSWDATKQQGNESKQFSNYPLPSLNKFQHSTTMTLMIKGEEGEECTRMTLLIKGEADEEYNGMAPMIRVEEGEECTRMTKRIKGEEYEEFNKMTPLINGEEFEECDRISPMIKGEDDEECTMMTLMIKGEEDEECIRMTLKIRSEEDEECTRVCKSYFVEPQVKKPLKLCPAFISPLLDPKTHQFSDSQEALNRLSPKMTDGDDRQGFDGLGLRRQFNSSRVTTSRQFWDIGNQGTSRRNIRQGLENVHNNIIDNEFLDNYDGFEPGDNLTRWFPQPGDIMITKRSRPRDHLSPGGYVTLYKDKEFFFFTREAREMRSIQYDFQDGDVVVRLGKFTEDWKWHPSSPCIETFLLDARHVRPWWLVARTYNNDLQPPEYQFDAFRPPVNSVDRTFCPRIGDLVVRAVPGEYEWGLYWWNHCFNFSPCDLVLRAGYEIRANGTCMVVELYYREIDDRDWSFRGRDVWTYLSQLHNPRPL